MDKKITYLNPNIEDYNEYTLIIEDDNNQRILTKKDNNIEELLKQEILIKKIKKEKENISEENILTSKNINNNKTNIIMTISIALFISILPSLVIKLTGLNYSFYSPRFEKEILFSTVMTYFYTSIAIPVGTTLFINNIIKLKKEKTKVSILEIQEKELEKTLEKETTKLKELKQKVNLEKNSIKLETKNIDATEEFNKIIDKLQTCSEKYYKNTEKTNKYLIKKI